MLLWGHVPKFFILRLTPAVLFCLFSVLAHHSWPLFLGVLALSAFLALVVLTSGLLFKSLGGSQIQFQTLCIAAFLAVVVVGTDFTWWPLFQKEQTAMIVPQEE